MFCGRKNTLLGLLFLFWRNHKNSKFSRARLVREERRGGGGVRDWERKKKTENAMILIVFPHPFEFGPICVRRPGRDLRCGSVGASRPFVVIDPLTRLRCGLWIVVSEQESRSEFPVTPDPDRYRCGYCTVAGGVIAVSLQDCTEAPVCGDAFPRTCIAIGDGAGGGLAMAESETDKDALVHLLGSLGHLFERVLLIVHFLVLRHVCLVAEVVKVSSVGLGVEFRYEGRALIAEIGPVDFGEIRVCADLGNGVESGGLG